MGQYIASIVLAVVGVIANLFSYVYMAKIIIGLVDGNKNINFYLSICMVILLMFLIKEISAGISSLVSHTATFRSLGEIRNDISQKLFKMPLGDVMSRSSGELKNIIVEQVDSMETSLAHLVPEFTANIVGPLLLFIYMLMLDWRLALLSLVPLVIGLSVTMSVMNKTIKRIFKIGVHRSKNE